MELIHNNERIEEYRQRAYDLVQEMTLEEKASQMLHGVAAIERMGMKSYNWWNETLHGVARTSVNTGKYKEQKRYRFM